MPTPRNPNSRHFNFGSKYANRKNLKKGGVAGQESESSEDKVLFTGANSVLSLQTNERLCCYNTDHNM